MMIIRELLVLQFLGQTLRLLYVFLLLLLLQSSMSQVILFAFYLDLFAAA
jgi:hypothetical protein